MGIWDDHGFANNEALDWLGGLDAQQGLLPVRQLLHAVVAVPAPTLDVRQAGHAIAAIELVAAASGRPHPALPATVREWCRRLDEAPDEDTLILATRALDFVGTSSALAELWSQRLEEDEWLRELDDLRMRLTPAVVPPPRPERASIGEG